MVSPYPSTHVTRASGKQFAHRTRCDRDHAILVALKHELGDTSERIPELNAAVCRAGYEPGTIGSDSNGENAILFQILATALDEHGEDVLCGRQKL